VNFDNHIKAAHERKLRAHNAMTAIVDGVKAGEEFTAEQREAFDRCEADIQSANDEIARFQRAASYGEARDAELARITTASAPVETVRSDADILRSLALGDVRSFHFETRDVVKTSTGAPVPTSFYNQLVEHLVVVGPMLDPGVATVINTQGGENLQIPRTDAYSTAAIVGEGTAISESDPTFQAFTTLGAFKYSVLFQVSREMIEDTGVDLLGFVARQAGVSLGTAVNKGLTTGTGTVQPWGVVARAASASVTGGTGVSGAATYENLVDLAYAVNSAYRRQGASWMGNAKAAAMVRKIKDGSGAYIWQPSFQVGQPDTLLGHPWLENPDMVDPAVNAKSVIFGHMPSYFVRQVRGVDIARSDEFAFSADLVTFRATLRVDGDLPQTGAIKYFVGGTA
jgi:HK97 family phage major capsid protein